MVTLFKDPAQLISLKILLEMRKTRRLERLKSGKCESCARTQICNNLSESLKSVLIIQEPISKAAETIRLLSNSSQAEIKL